MAAFFSASETAVFSLTKTEKKRIAEKHPFLSKFVSGHLENPRKTLIGILIGNMMAHTLATSLATIMIYDYLGPGWLSLGLTVFTILLIFLAEIIPKTVAVTKNEKMSLLVALPLKFFVILSYPIRKIVRLITDKILSFLLSDAKEHAEHFSEDEIKTLVDIGAEEGVLDSHERYMLQKLLELGERPVKDIMIPRIDVAGLNIEDSREENIALIRKRPFSHFLVYQESIDNLLGVVSTQDYVLFPEKNIQELLIPALFVPDVKRIDDLLAEFRIKSQDFAVCLDEYGGTAGIVMLEDIMEEIFGEFDDEYAKVEHPIRATGHNEYIVEAKLPLVDFNEFFSLQIKSEDASTLGGFILEQLGELPEKGRTIKIPECEFVVHDVIRHKRIKSVIVRPQL